MADCWRIVTEVEQTGLVYGLAEQTRFWGVVEGWRQLVAEGRLGKITYAEGQYVGWYGTRQYFQDFKTGRQYPVESLPDHPEAEPTVLHSLPVIIGGIGSHDMSVVLNVLDDRVVDVVWDEHEAAELRVAPDLQTRYSGRIDEDGEGHGDSHAVRVYPAQAAR